MLNITLEDVWVTCLFQPTIEHPFAIRLAFFASQMTATADTQHESNTNSGLGPANQPASVTMICCADACLAALVDCNHGQDAK